MRLFVEGYPPAEVVRGQSMLEVCEAARIPMLSSCGGFAACNSCRVDVLSGGEVLEPLRLEEEAFLDHPGQRLGCQATFLGTEGDVRVRLAPGV